MRSGVNSHILPSTEFPWLDAFDFSGLKGSSSTQQNLSIPLSSEPLPPWLLSTIFLSLFQIIFVSRLFWIIPPPSPSLSQILLETLLHICGWLCSSLARYPRQRRRLLSSSGKSWPARRMVVKQISRYPITGGSSTKAPCPQMYPCGGLCEFPCLPSPAHLQCSHQSHNRILRLPRVRIRRCSKHIMFGMNTTTRAMNIELICNNMRQRALHTTDGRHIAPVIMWLFQWPVVPSNFMARWGSGLPITSSQITALYGTD